MEMPTIRIDEEVYRWLQKRATPFEDSPNSVLRKIASLDQVEEGEPKKSAETKVTLLSGKVLAGRWKVDVSHALYHRDGTFFENLLRFPGALFDPNGFLVFKTREEYLRSPHLRIGQKLNVPGGISGVPGYKKMK